MDSATRKIHRVLVKREITLGQVVLDDENTVHHLVNVLRAQVGTKIRIFNEANGEWLAEVAFVLKRKSITLNILSFIRNAEPRSKISLAFALVKPERTKFIIEKATEIGVNELIPIISDRCIARSLNTEKAQAYAINAVEQSERLLVPFIREAQKLQDFFSRYNSGTIVFCNEFEENVSIREMNKEDENQIVLVGPEGGFTNEERLLALSHQNVKSVYLTKNILRSETAAIFAISNLI